MLKIGELKHEQPVYISANSANEHLLLIGVSGSGKSTRIKEVIESARKEGDTVIAFDINGTDYCRIEEEINLINVCGSGIAIPVFTTQEENRQYLRTVTETVDLFASVANLGVRQQEALRKAVDFAMKNPEKDIDAMRAIEVGLVQQKNNVADGVRTKLWGLLKGNFFNASASGIEEQKLNVINLQGVASATQRQLIEFILRLLWRDCRKSVKTSQKRRIVIDEFQNLNLSKLSVLMEMLREARKYQIGLILATQTISIFPKEILAAINQTAVQLYFKTSASDIKKIAEYIEPNHGYRWTSILKSLRIGESVANGSFSIRGYEFDKPIIIQSAYKN